MFKSALVGASLLLALNVQASLSVNPTGRAIELVEGRDTLTGDELKAWVNRELDPLGGSRVPPMPSGGELLAGTNSTVDRSCLSRFNPGEKSQLETAITHAMVRADRCEQVYGFHEMSCVRSVLQRARFSCAERENACAWAYKTVRRGLVRASSRYEPNFMIGLDLGCVTRGSNRRIRKPVQSLIHEALHHCAANNQTTHDHNQGARLHDRVYMISAACDPEAFEHPYGAIGRSVFQEGPLMRGCMRALTRVDDRLEQTSAENPWSWIFGPPVRGRIVSEREAQIYCEHVVEVVQEVKKYKRRSPHRRRWVQQFRSQVARYERALQRVRPAVRADQRGITRALAKIHRLEPLRGSIGNAVVAMAAAREEVAEAFDSVCSTEQGQMRNARFCGNGMPIAQGLIQAIERTENTIPVAVRLLSRD